MFFYPDLVLNILYHTSLIGIVGYLLTRFPLIRRTVTRSEYRLQDKVMLGFIFGGISILGTWMGIPVLGSSANQRIVGPIAGGLLGGPLVGFIAGALGAFVRYFIGGFTMWPAVWSNILAGLISGFVYIIYKQERMTVKTVLATALICELLLKFMIITLSESFEAAVALEQAIALPTILANCSAVVFFCYIVGDVFREQDKAQALSVQKSLRMIRQTTSFLQKGLNEHTAAEIAQIIYHETQAAAISITDDKKVLAFIGEGADHHAVGTPIITAATKRAIERRQTVITSGRQEIGCPHQGCMLTAVIDAPLLVGDQLLGTIKLYKINYETISYFEREVIQGIADFLGPLLAQQKLAEKQQLLLQTEYNMLKAQINPHFFFNTLGTVQALVLADPKTASALIKDLAQLLRRMLKRGQEIVTLGEELETVSHYSRIEKVRFGSRLEIVISISEELLSHPVPVFSLQPLVENAIRHGLSRKKGGGQVEIKAWPEGKFLYVQVQDNGVGMAKETLQSFEQGEMVLPSSSGTGIGLQNVNKRLQSLYGAEYGLAITSQIDAGTTVTVCLPYMITRGNP
ncbi:MAG: LytS/YhcK type 5TM receptor domain-containing protein [Sporomusaceae bacterium]|nr:LytS/YhcK type 5TM receptor domain-containing protein [Sporomusaceae bacterium]